MIVTFWPSSRRLAIRPPQERATSSGWGATKTWVMAGRVYRARPARSRHRSARPANPPAPMSGTKTQAPCGVSVQSLPVADRRASAPAGRAARPGSRAGRRRRAGRGARPGWPARPPSRGCRRTAPGRLARGCRRRPGPRRVPDAVRSSRAARAPGAASSGWRSMVRHLAPSAARIGRLVARAGAELEHPIAGPRRRAARSSARPCTAG